MIRNTMDPDEIDKGLLVGSSLCLKVPIYDLVDVAGDITVQQKNNSNMI